MSRDMTEVLTKRKERLAKRIDERYSALRKAFGLEGGPLSHMEAVQVWAALGQSERQQYLKAMTPEQHQQLLAALEGKNGAA